MNDGGLSASQKTAAKVKSGVNDVKGKMQHMEEKKDLLSQNFKMVDEVQNMRFMIQEKESQITRLNF